MNAPNPTKPVDINKELIKEFSTWSDLLETNLEEIENPFLRGYVAALKAVIDYLKKQC